MSLDGTNALVQSLRIGDLVAVDVVDWYPGADVKASVHIVHIEPEGDAGERDIVARVCRCSIGE